MERRDHERGTWISIRLELTVNKFIYNRKEGASPLDTEDVENEVLNLGVHATYMNRISVWIAVIGLLNGNASLQLSEVLE